MSYVYATEKSSDRDDEYIIIDIVIYIKHKNITIQLVAQGQLDMEGALTARDRVGIQDFVLLDETTDAAFLSNLKKRFSRDLIYVSLGKQLLKGELGAYFFLFPWLHLDGFWCELLTFG